MQLNCMPPPGCVRLPRRRRQRGLFFFFLISKLPRRVPLIGRQQRMRVDARALAGRRSGHVLAGRGVSRRKFRALRRGGVFLKLINRARAPSGRPGHGSDASSRRARRLLGNAGFAVLRREIGCADGVRGLTALPPSARSEARRSRTRGLLRNGSTIAALARATACAMLSRISISQGRGPGVASARRCPRP